MTPGFSPRGKGRLKNGLVQRFPKCVVSKITSTEFEDSGRMNDSRKPIVVVGSINMDLVAHTRQIPVPGETVIGTGFATTPGGKGANQAVAAARLGYPVSMVGAVGDD